MAVGILVEIGALAALVSGGAQFAAWRRWHHRASLWWTAANCTGTAGAVLLLGHGVLPGWAGQTLANTLILSGTLLIWLGFRSLAGQPPRPGIAAAAALIFLAVFEVLRLLAHDLGALILFASFALGMVNAVTAFDLARAWRGRSLRLRSFLVWAFALHALFYLFRSATAMTVEAGAEFLTTAGLQSVTLLLGVAEVLIWNAASLRMAASYFPGDTRADPAA